MLAERSGWAAGLYDRNLVEFSHYSTTRGNQLCQLTHRALKLKRIAECPGTNDCSLGYNFMNYLARLLLISRRALAPVLHDRTVANAKTAVEGNQEWSSIGPQIRDQGLIKKA